jgi:hypothetical protein
MPVKKLSPYRTFLLRCWQEGRASPGGRFTWRFSVEDVLDKRRRQGFGSFEQVIAYLRKMLANPEDESSPDYPVSSLPDKAEGANDHQ